MKASAPVTIKLANREQIIAVVPEYCAGPGWSNAPTWVYIRQADGSVRQECIQPDGRSPALHTLFAAGAAMCGALIDAVPVIKAKAGGAK